MSQRRRSETDRARHWRRLIAAWQRSGLSQVDYCRERGINAGTFAWWKRRLTAEAAGGAKRGFPHRRRVAAKTGQFVEVCVPDSKTISAPISMTPANSATEPVCEIILARGRSIRLFGALDPASVSRLITVVESAC
jgi:hypothetical protein